MSHKWYKIYKIINFALFVIKREPYRNGSFIKQQENTNNHIMHALVINVPIHNHNCHPLQIVYNVTVLWLINN